MTGLGYLVLELFDRLHEATATFNIYLSASIASYAARNVEGVSTDYDDTKADAPNALHAIENDTTTLIGDRFSASMSIDGAADSPAITLELTIDNENTITIFMKAMLSEETVPSGEVRYAMHYVLIEQAAAYKCASCGLCGNFKDKYKVISDTQRMCPRRTTPMGGRGRRTFSRTSAPTTRECSTTSPTTTATISSLMRRATQRSNRRSTLSARTRAMNSSKVRAATRWAICAIRC